MRRRRTSGRTSSRQSTLRAFWRSAKHRGPAPVHSPLDLFATILSPGKSLGHTFKSGSAARKGYVHVIQTSGYNPKEASGARVRVLGAEGGPVDLREGDGAYIMATPGEEVTVENAGETAAEVVFFDME